MSDNDARNEAALTSMVRTRVAEMPPEFAAWSSADRVYSWWRACFAAEHERCRNLDIARKQAMQIGRGDPEDHLHRLVPVQGGVVLCGIRFFGGDAARPFVDILGWTAEITDLGDASRVVLAEFQTFAPERTRVFAAARPPEEAAGWSMDQVVSVGALREIANGDIAGMRLEPCTEDEAVRFVESVYSQRCDAKPALRDLLFPAGHEELAACRASGRLMWWLIDDKRAGMIAVEQASYFGLDGFLMIEEVRDPAFRGRGSASRAQQLLAADLVSEFPRATLFGTIDAANEASREAARRAGRRELAAYWFISG